MRYIVSAHCMKEELVGNKNNIYHRHLPFVVEAVSSDEALGKALRIWLKVLPQADGWAHHHVQVAELTEKCVVTFENAALLP